MRAVQRPRNDCKSFVSLTWVRPMGCLWSGSFAKVLSVSAFLSMDSAESRSTLGQCSPGRFVRLRMLSFSVAFRPADETIPPIRADKVRAAMPSAWVTSGIDFRCT